MKQYTTEQVRKTVNCLTEIVEVLNKDEYFNLHYSMWNIATGQSLPLSKLIEDIEQKQDEFFQELHKREKAELRQYKQTTKKVKR